MCRLALTSAAQPPRARPELQAHEGSAAQVRHILLRSAFTSLHKLYPLISEGFVSHTSPHAEIYGIPDIPTLHSGDQWLSSSVTALSPLPPPLPSRSTCSFRQKFVSLYRLSRAPNYRTVPHLRLKNVRPCREYYLLGESQVLRRSRLSEDNRK